MAELDSEMFPPPVMRDGGADLVVWIPEGCSPDGLLEPRITELIPSQGQQRNDHRGPRYSGVVAAAGPGGALLHPAAHPSPFHLSASLRHCTPAACWLVGAEEGSTAGGLLPDSRVEGPLLGPGAVLPSGCAGRC